MKLFLTLLMICFSLLPLQNSYAAETGISYPARLHTARLSLLGEYDTLTLRILSPLTIDACANVHPISYQISYDRTAMDIMVGDYSYNLTGDTCDKGAQMAIANIPLNVKTLEEKNVTLIRLWKGNSLDAFTLTLNESGASLVPTKKLKFFQPLTLNALSRQFTNKDAIVLYLEEQSIVDLSDKISDLARAKGLVPDTSRPAARGHAQPTFYFLDKNHTYSKKLKQTPVITFGTVEVKVDRNGPYRSYGDSVSYTVYAKKP